MSSVAISPPSPTPPDPFTIWAKSRKPPSPPRWYSDPVTFARDCIEFPAGAELTDYQADVLTQLAQRHRVAQRGPHGLGKTADAAIAIHWFALSRDLAGTDWKIITTAGGWGQLERYLWPEIHLWAGRLRWDVIGRPPYNRATELLSLNLKLRHGAASAVASSNPALIEGAHASSIFYVFDESKAIEPDIFDAAEGAFSVGEAYALASSTPGEPVGRFYDIHSRKPGYEDWATRHVTQAEVVAAGRMNPDWAAQKALQWGVTSATYINRVLGEFASSDEDGVIPLAWIEAANRRWFDWQAAGAPLPAVPTVIGVDVADTGGDQTVYATRQGDIVVSLERHSHQDLMVTAGQVAAKLTHPSFLVCIDAIGVGSGVASRLREEGHRVASFIAGAKSDLRDRSGEIGFINARAAAWWRLRELLDPAFESNLALPDDDLLTGDLTAPHWRFNSTGKIQIESKDDIKKRLGRSTDTGDAVVQAFWATGSGAPAYSGYSGLELVAETAAFPSRRDQPWWEVADA